MKRSLYVLVFVVALAALTFAQMSGSPGTPPSSSGSQPEMSGPQRPVGPGEGQSTPGAATTPGSQVPDSPNQGKTAASTVDDNTLRQQVQQQLNSDPNMKGVQASVQDGEVDLTGTVPSKDDKKKAKKLVGAIPGVRKVKEHLTVGASAGSSGGSNEPAEAKGSPAATPSGSGMSASASAASPSASASSPSASASASPSANGSASAQSSTTNTAGSIAGNSGAASSKPEASASAASSPTAGATHGSISGNTSAAGQTATAQAGAATANGSAKDVEKAINSQIAGANVQVKEKDHNLTLTGTVPRDVDRQQAETIAATVAGPKTVIDQLEATSGGGASASAAPANPSQPQASATGSTGTSGATTSATMGSQAGATAAGQTGTAAGATAAAPATQAGAPASTASTTGTAATSAATPGQTAQAAPAAGATGAAGGAGSADVALQQQIQTAIQSEPTLAGDHVTVNVAPDAIDVAGTVNTGKERQSALRIAQSYAGNRRVNDKLTVKGMGQGANNGMTPAGNAPGASSTTPATGSPMSPNPSNPNSTPPQTPRQ